MSARNTVPLVFKNRQEFNWRYEYVNAGSNTRNA